MSETNPGRFVSVSHVKCITLLVWGTNNLSFKLVIKVEMLGCSYEQIKWFNGKLQRVNVNVRQTASMSMLTLFESRRMYTWKGRYNIGNVTGTKGFMFLNNLVVGGGGVDFPPTFPSLRPPDWRAGALPTELASHILAVSLFCQYLCSRGASQKSFNHAL